MTCQNKCFFFPFSFYSVNLLRLSEGAENMKQKCGEGRPPVATFYTDRKTSQVESTEIMLTKPPSAQSRGNETCPKR